MSDTYTEFVSYDKYFTHRKWLAYCFVMVLFLDIFTTYFALTQFHFSESVTWTQHILNQYGWNGIIIRFIVSSVIFLLIFRFTPNLVMKYTRIPFWIILAVYVYESSFNNTILMMGAN